jgi:hypothetical protein
MNVRALVLIGSPPVLVALLSLVFPPFDVRAVAVAAVASVVWTMWGVLVPDTTRGLTNAIEVMLLLATMATWIGCIVAVAS